MTDCERNRPLRSLEELQKFDSNGDGRIDMNDRAFLNLTLWSDKNLNNLCEPGETRLLPDLRIKALVIENTDALKPVKIFNASARAVGFMEAAENVDLYEVNFTPLSVRKRYVGPREVSDEIAKLPNLNGLGSLIDLHYAAMADPGLADLLTQLKNLEIRMPGSFSNFILRCWSVGAGLTVFRLMKKYQGCRTVNWPYWQKFPVSVRKTGCKKPEMPQR